MANPLQFATSIMNVDSKNWAHSTLNIYILNLFYPCILFVGFTLIVYYWLPVFRFSIAYIFRGKSIEISPTIHSFVDV
jgi:hypothetical protein